MDKPLQLTVRGMTATDDVEEHVRKQTAKLEKLESRITSCHVTVEARHQHRQKGNLYSVRVDIHLPGKDIAVDRERRRDPAHEDVHVAIRDAFDAAVRRLEDHARRRRGQVKRHRVAPRGSIARLFPGEGHGFVEMADGAEVYFHANSVAGGAFSTLEIGDEVRVVIAEGEGEKGPQASAVTPVGRRRT